MTISDQALSAALAAFICAMVLTRGVHYAAMKFKLLDTPNLRSSHLVPVPRIGGIAFVTATAIGCSLVVETIDWTFVVIALGSLLLAAVGLLDDLRPLRAWQKYSPQIVAATAVAIITRPTFYIDFPFAEGAIQGVGAIVIGIIWITAVTNAFNFMDGIDGIAAGVGLIAAVSVAIMVGGMGLLILTPLAASLAGFLVWNMHPAIIFMGDVGSQFIGFLLSTAALLGTQESIPAIPVVIIFIPFLFDTSLTIIRRLKAHENIFTAHRSHLYQRLTITGASHRAVANLYFGATAVCALVAFMYRSASAEDKTILIALGIVLLTVYAAVVARLEQQTTAPHRQGNEATKAGESINMHSTRDV